MFSVERLGSYLSRGVGTVSGPFHPFGGAVDIIVVEQPDGTFKSSPWYVRFGKFQGVLKATEKVVNISVNEVEADFHMYLDHKGQAYFLKEVDGNSMMSLFYPSSSGDETDGQSPNKRRPMKSKSCNTSDRKWNSNDHINAVPRTNTTSRAQSLGLFLGRSSIKEDGFQETESGAVVRVGSLERAEIAADLLEVQWSTNLATRKYSSNHTPSHKCDDDMPISDEQNQEMQNLSVVEEKSDFLFEISRKIEESSIMDAECDEQNIVLQGCDILEEKSESDRAQSFIYYNTSRMATKLPVEETTTKGTEDVELEIDNAEVLKHLFQQANASPRRCNYSNVYLEGPPTLSESCSQLCQEPVCHAAEGAKIHRISDPDRQIHLQKKNMSGTSESQLQITDNFSHSGGDCIQERALSSLPSDNLEEQQFLFSDLDEPKLKEILFKGSNILDVKEGEKPPDADEFQPLANQICIENASIDLNKPTQNLKSELSFVSIPATNTRLDKEPVRLVESLPNMWCQNDNLGKHKVHSTISHSLDSNSESLKVLLSSTHTQLNTEVEKELSEKDLVTQDTNGLEDFKNGVSYSTIGDPAEIPRNGSWKIWPFSRSKSGKGRQPQPSLTDERRSNSNTISKNTCGSPKVMKNKVREKTPTSEQLESLNLKEGRNTISFTFYTAMLGKQEVEASIYLWKWNARIVISDVDGTITKSDVLGQFMPMVGVDWSQTGVAHLFSAIKENGYQVLFLSARAISQAYHTRQFLGNLKQDGKFLPDGPIVISPDGLFPSLYREVIRRVPHEFKIGCLEDIKALFPSDCNPFYAGFGNRNTDEISYLKVGIPMGKIFIINPKGEVAVHRRIDTKSYSSLHALVHGMFPPMASEREDFNNWNFWKLPPPSI